MRTRTQTHKTSSRKNVSRRKVHTVLTAREKGEKWVMSWPPTRPPDLEIGYLFSESRKQKSYHTQANLAHKHHLSRSERSKVILPFSLETIDLIHTDILSNVMTIWNKSRIGVALFGCFVYCQAWIPRPNKPLLSSRAATTTTTTTRLHSSTAVELPRLSQDQLQVLKTKKYLVVPDFLTPSLQHELRGDVQNLRTTNHFKTAKIGQDSTNTLNTDIRVAETCFLGNNNLPQSTSRDKLYQVLNQVRTDLATFMQRPLDENLGELLYAYYPQGGFYRRHRDAISGSASVLRTYSLLLYLNDPDWNAKVDKGELRMHFDSGGDELPVGEEPNFLDVVPAGGTLVLFESDAIPHEVLDTQKERIAVVGWYNRPVGLTDIAELSPGGEPSFIRLAMLGVSFALVTVGVMGLLS